MKEPASKPVIEESGAEDELESVASLSDVLGIMEDLEGQLQAAYAMREALTQDLTSANEELARLRETHEEQKRRVRYLEEKMPDVEMLREELEFSEQEKARSQGLIAELTENAEKATLAISEQTDALDEARSQLKDVKTANVKLEFDLGLLRKQHVELLAVEKEHKRLLQEHGKSIRRLETLEGSLAKIQGVQADLEADLAATRATMAKLQAENEKLTAETQGLEQDNKQLEAETAHLQRENDELKHQAAELDQNLGAAQRERERLEVDLATARKTMADIHSALARTKARTRQLGVGG